MPEKKVEIENCLASKKISSKASDESAPRDNDFHCPITGEWVKLIRKDNKFTCVNGSCNNDIRL